ncbi:MAG TPA: hypothetical protein VFW03_21165, partial [Gemmatimonadaceae bacterium]|nr:hypothetical protein [Gemmatimonadaceae bacterium]
HVSQAGEGQLTDLRHVEIIAPGAWGRGLVGGTRSQPAPPDRCSRWPYGSVRSGDRCGAARRLLTPTPRRPDRDADRKAVEQPAASSQR